jgi:enoyl-CoA hydratase
MPSIGAVETADRLVLERPEAHPGVLLLRLNRPDRLNALSWEMIEELGDLLRGPRMDGARVLVVTGTGRGFCSGLDLGGSDAVGSVGGIVEVYERQEKVAGVALAMRALPIPVIAAVNGPAAGGGFSISLAAEIRIAARGATFVASFARLGLSGGDVGASYLLPRIVGYGVAADILLTGRRVDADEALRIGLANAVVDDDAVVETALAKADEIVANSPFGVKMTKQILARNVDAGGLEPAIELENRTQVLATRTEDMPEAVAAFLERRPPDFTGR